MADEVLLLTTGGTIASTAGSAGAVTTVSGPELLELVPDVRERIHIEEIVRRPSPNMDFAVLDRVRDRIAAHAAHSDAGVVVTHGTDTMEESAYYLDLVTETGPPIVFTGAQRRPDQPGFDGPANVVDSVSASTEPALLEAGGVYVCLNGELHAARDVVKAHTWRPDTFESPTKGPVAVFGPDGFKRNRELGSRSVTLQPEREPTGEVEVVTTGIGSGPEQIERAVASECDGIVLQATGLGNAPESITDAVGDAIDVGIPVVVTSRCHAGGVSPVYGGGGGQTLRDRGAIFGGDLPPWKARIKLLTALESPTDVRRAFAED